MTSLFSRSRTKSTPQKGYAYEGNGHSDEFGRVPSRGAGILSTPSSRKEKKKSAKVAPSPVDEDLLESQFPDGSFLPLNLERPRPATTVTLTVPAGDANNVLPVVKPNDYGYLSHERHVVLGLDQLERLVEVISDELDSRGGITTPFIFSNTALDISSSSIKRLIRAFLATCDVHNEFRAQEAENKWREEARFAGPHELGMCLRWGLARVIRSVGGQDVRGLVSWEHYVEFRETESELGYPSTHFATQFLPPLTPTLQAIIIRLLALLARLIANSTSSGHTPPTLSPLFGPLFFGVGPATLTFHHSYIHYLRAVTAMEHIILAFIRWQDTPRMSASHIGGSASAATLGVPVRLKEWIKGYPATLPVLDIKKPQPRRGARTIRVMSVRRNVRMYSPDLVKTAATWAHKAPGFTNNGLANSKEWERIAPITLRFSPRYSEAYKKKMDMPPGFHPDIAPGAAISLSPSQSSTASSTNSAVSTTTATSANSQMGLLPEIDYFGLGHREGDDRFRSLTDLKWGEFESIGFNKLGDEKKLQFDLTESARTERKVKRQTMSWNDFSSDGFSRTDAPLSATLQFSTPFTAMISSWPTQNAEITRKLKKTHKALPAFGWDTEPVVGNEEVIEEAFVDVFCDLIYGGGWMDLERGEMLDRDCNWALVEYKSLPPSKTTVSGITDPRTAVTLVLFEEFVPLEYREQLAIKSSSRRRLPSLFSSSSGKKHWKPAATLNGRPYVVGHVPIAPSPREVEFEGLLHGNNSTRILSLGPKRSMGGLTRPESTSTIAGGERTLAPPMIRMPVRPPEKASATTFHHAKSDDTHSNSNSDRTVINSTFMLSSMNTSSPIKKSLFRPNRKSMIPAEYSTVEFETRMASYSDDEANGDGRSGMDEPEEVKQRRRESSADAWVDILVGTQDRLGPQSAEMRPDKRRKSDRKSDPDLASKEVEKVLASVSNLRAPSPGSSLFVDRERERDYGGSDTDVVEVETVPRLTIVKKNGHASNRRRSLDSEEESSQAHAGGDEADEVPPAALLNTRQVLRQQRRLGYFDLHPERRQAQAQSIVDDDPRERLAGDSDDEDGSVYADAGSGEGSDYAHADRVRRPLPIPPGRTTVISTMPTTKANLEPSPVTPVKSVIQSLNRSPEVNKAAIPQTPNSPGLTKTAALIEMYRERERGGSSHTLGPRPSTSPGALGPSAPVVTLPVTPLAPSRLPVRSSSSPPNSNIPDIPPPPTVPAPVPVPTTPPKVTPVPIPPLQKPTLAIPEPDDHLSGLDIGMEVEVPGFALDETGRSSPGRYVHGAPLHNVLEEEEEYDD